MDDTLLPIRYTAEDHQPRGVEDLSRHARVSCAFVRLCIELGCPMPGGRLSHASMLEWLALNYDAVRAMAGLRPMAPLDGVSAKARRELQLANTMLTLLEFAESRSTNLEEKAQLRMIQRLIERAV